MPACRRTSGLRRTTVRRLLLRQDRNPTAAPPPTQAEDLTYVSRVEPQATPRDGPKPAPEKEPAAAPVAKTVAPAASVAPPQPVTPPQPVAPPRSAAPPPASAPLPVAAPVPPTPGQAFAVQVAALNSRDEADEMARRLTSKGYLAFVLAPASGASAVYRVRLGPVQDPSRSRRRGGPARKGRADQALGRSLTVTRVHGSVLAAVSGALLAGSFPEPGHPAVAWIALAPLLLTLTSGSPRRAFTLGFLAGVIYFTGTLHWITRVMAVYGGLQPWVAVLVNGALIVFLALFPAVFAVIVRIATTKFGRPATRGGAARVGGD